MSRGVSSTEFYIVLGVTLFTILGRKFGIEMTAQEHTTLLAIVGAYIGSRTIVKLRNGGSNGGNGKDISNQPPNPIPGKDNIIPG